MSVAGGTNAGNYSHMPGFEEYVRKSKKWQREANRANLSKKIKGRHIENAFRSPKYGAFVKKAIKKL